ncbi:unnamed protein product, partial [Allacma fusca]
MFISGPIGKWDFRAVASAGQKDDSDRRFTIQWFERAMNILSKLTTKTKYYSQVSVVFDCNEFPYRQLASKRVITMLIEMIKTFEDNYPEILRVIFVINAPAIFSILWGIIKPFLTERTTSKIRIHGSDRTKWRADILSMINEDNLPSAYGGANTTCQNYRFQTDIPTTSSIVPCFGKYPEGDLRQVHIGARELYTVEVNATLGLRINWIFRTDDHDIFFRVDFEDVEDTVEPCRVDSDL